MKPSFWSRNAFEENKVGWYQYGTDVKYEPSPYTDDNNELNPMSRRFYMQLSFTYSFQTANDEVFCAYTVPYNYTALQAHIKQLKLLTCNECK